MFPIRRLLGRNGLFTQIQREKDGRTEQEKKGEREGGREGESCRRQTPREKTYLGREEGGGEDLLLLGHLLYVLVVEGRRATGREGGKEGGREKGWEGGKEGRDVPWAGGGWR